MATSPVNPLSISTQKIDVQAVHAALITGINSDLGAVDTFVLGKTTLTRAQLVAHFQARIDAADKVKASRAALQQSIDDEHNADAISTPLRASMKKYLQARYGLGAPELQRFGFTQGRKAKTAPSVKAAAALKARATRLARGTKGVQQKKPIHGTVPAGSPAPAASPTPAPPNGAAGTTAAVTPPHP